MASRPLYLELAEQLIRDMREGKYPVGTLLPPEIEIATSHGISRATARSALNYLVSLGLVTRRQGIGTRVEACEAPPSYTASTASIAELAHFGAATKRQVHCVRRIVADDVLARRLECRPGQRWVLVEATRCDPAPGNQPICWTENYIDERFEDVVDRIAEYGGLIVDLLSETHGLQIHAVEQRIAAVIMNAQIASNLAALAGLPALQITRHYLSLRAAEVISISTHPADLFEHRMSLRRP